MAKMQTRTTSGYERVAGAVMGCHYQTNHKPDVGEDFDHDGNHWMQNPSADISTTNKTSGLKFYGKNGVAHYTHVAVGNDKNCFPTRNISGFRFKAYWEGSGRQIYLRRWGYSLRRKTNNTQWVVQSGKGGQNSTGDRTITVDFSSDTNNKLRSGDWVFNEVHLQWSTGNCCGDRTSTAYIWGFEYYWVHAGNGKKMILPQPIDYGDRGSTYRIA